MEHTSHIPHRAALWAMLCLLCLAFTSATAAEPDWWTKKKRDCNLPRNLAYNDWDGKCNSSPSGSTSTPSYDFEAERRAQAEAAERQRQQEEAARLERERQVAEQARLQAEFIAGRDEAAGMLKGSSAGSAMSQLKGFAGTDDTGLKGSGFDSGSLGLKGLRGSTPAAGNSSLREAPHTDPKVVDARVTKIGAYWTNQVPELKNSPVADRISDGYEAVINHDWPVALAIWQSALHLDPNNGALQRSVELAHWMVERKQDPTKAPVTVLGAAVNSIGKGDYAESIRKFELAKREYPSVAKKIDAIIADLRTLHKEQLQKAVDDKMLDELLRREFEERRQEQAMDEQLREALRESVFYSTDGAPPAKPPSRRPATKPAAKRTK